MDDLIDTLDSLPEDSREHFCALFNCYLHVVIVANAQTVTVEDSEPLEVTH